MINVSNAPPVSLKRADSGEWTIGQGSGGLVTCVGPVLSQNKDNVWLACFGPSAHFHSSDADGSAATNSLGLPLMRAARTKVVSRVLNDEEESQSLVSVLDNYNKDNAYQLSPVTVTAEDYNTYYGGVSNGLLWPACHGLKEYIVKDYDDPAILAAHWAAYVRVNYQFALNAVRNSRPQDFIWIHDYHLLLTGLIMQSLDKDLEVGISKSLSS